MIKILNKKFFERPTLVVAKDLLGKYLVSRVVKVRQRRLRRQLKKSNFYYPVRRVGRKTTRYLITEVEAYDGFKDKASHASRGLTKRNAPMFGEARRWYVYFTYGMHYMLNIVTGPKNYPAAILIRSVDGISGPARITKQLEIDKRFNDKIANPKTGLWIATSTKSERASLKNVFSSGKMKIENFPRIGVAYAGPIWLKKKWRFTFVVDKSKN